MTRSFIFLFVYFSFRAVVCTFTFVNSFFIFYFKSAHDLSQLHRKTTKTPCYFLQTNSNTWCFRWKAACWLNVDPQSVTTTREDLYFHKPLSHWSFEAALRGETSGTALRRFMGWLKTTIGKHEKTKTFTIRLLHLSYLFIYKFFKQSLSILNADCWQKQNFNIIQRVTKLRFILSVNDERWEVFLRLSRENIIETKP